MKKLILVVVLFLAACAPPPGEITVSSTQPAVVLPTNPPIRVEVTCVQATAVP